MPVRSAQVLELLSLEDPNPSLFRPYDGKTRKFYRPRKRRTKSKIPVELWNQLDHGHTAPPAGHVVPEDEVEELPTATEPDRSLIPVGQPSRRQTRYGNSGFQRQIKSPGVAFAEPGRESDAFKVFPIAYQDCVPGACQFCQYLPASQSGNY